MANKPEDQSISQGLKEAEQFTSLTVRSARHTGSLVPSKLEALEGPVRQVQSHARNGHEVVRNAQRELRDMDKAERALHNNKPVEGLKDVLALVKHAHNARFRI